MSMLLEIKQLNLAYGASQVLFNFNLQIKPGEVATLLGRNGAGKTTTLRSILGLQRCLSGAIYFKGQALKLLRTDQIARLGIAIVPEGRQIFPNLSATENLIAFAANRQQRQLKWDLAQIYQLFPRLKERAHHAGNHLSGGEQQMLAIARALLTNPDLLILDEATEGLSPLLREEIWACLSLLKQRGQSILIVDKYVPRLLDLADQHTILERGQTVWQGESQLLRQQTELWQRHVGV